MASFSAYFDASGTKRTAVLTVAGYVSTVSKWGRFETEWKNILDREQVKLFHMTDFASHKEHFASWKGQTECRKTFIRDLADCIKKNTNKGMASSVALSDYKAADKEYLLSENAGKPLCLCARACLGTLERWAKRKEIDFRKISVFIEHGDEDMGEFIDFAYKNDGVTVRSLPKEGARAFQAGDLAGWKSRTALSNLQAVKHAEGALNILRSLDPIRGIVQRNSVHSLEALRTLCERSGIPKRTSGRLPA